MASVLVTGATGFIGSHVAELLVERGHDVTLGVQDGSPDTAIADLDCRRLKLELGDRRTVRRAVQGAEQVFPCAGLTSVRPEDSERLFAGLEEFRQHLYAPDMHDPDLLIRTSGELRLSNYLLWQCAYSEFVFRDELWPDFSREAFEAALAEYTARRRRFGGR